EFVGDARMRELIETSPSLDDAARAIAQAALDAGSRDNLTVQIARLESLAPGGIEELVEGEADLPPAPALRPGQEFEGYRILRTLHSGSRSHVYLAQDRQSGARCALKTLSTEMAQDPAAKASLLVEEWIMRRLDHPNLLRAPPLVRARRH